MSHHITFTMTRLLDVTRVLGTRGGLISPSEYDTAQLLRYTHTPDHRESIVQWLLTRQHADGGWGPPLIPRVRTIPTLAALIALNQYGGVSAVPAVMAAVAFLQQQAHVWAEVPDDIPVAAELLIPMLAATAQAQGLAVVLSAYAALAALGERRRTLLTQAPPRPASPLTHSWETWGTTPDVAVIDPTGGVGHNPAATAMWLHMAAGCNDLAQHVTRGDQYLEQAAATCSFVGPGIVPGVWPAPRNEQILALYHLHLFGLLQHPVLQDVVAAHMSTLWHAQRATGFGLSDEFSTDGDLTSMVFTLFKAWNYTPDLDVVRAYLAPDGRSCLSYPHELQRSRSTTAHAAHAFVQFGDRTQAESLLDSVLSSRDANNRLLGDKWHATWLYMNSHVIAVLCQMGQLDCATQLLAPVITDQHADGGWGIGMSTCEETAYAVLALHVYTRAGKSSDAVRNALCGAAKYLQQHTDQALLWYGKEAYRPYRVVRVLELAALFVSSQEVL